MRTHLRSTFLGLLTTGLALTLVAPPAPAAPQRCEVHDGPCRVTIVMTVYTGLPTIPCPSGDTVLKLVMTAKCQNQTASPVTDYVCASLAHAVSFSALGRTHTINPEAGATWGDAYGGDCDVLEYDQN